MGFNLLRPGLYSPCEPKQEISIRLFNFLQLRSSLCVYGLVHSGPFAVWKWLPLQSHVCSRHVLMFSRVRMKWMDATRYINSYLDTGLVLKSHTVPKILRAFPWIIYKKKEYCQSKIPNWSSTAQSVCYLDLFYVAISSQSYRRFALFLRETELLHWSESGCKYVNVT